MVPLDDCREPVFNTPEHQNLYAEVMALPAKYRLPLYLYYYEGYTAAEVGELLGLGPSTVRTRLARAREKLKAQLREERAMQNIYRETFEQIHASEQLRKEVANVPKQEKAAFRHHISKAGLIAAALALALAGTVLAVASPTLWWWFEQKWEEETGSVTSGDVTVTVDSITVGSSQIWALLDVTGWDFDRDAQYSFDRMRAEIVPDPSGGQHGGAGYGLDSIGITREGAARMLLEFSATISTGNQLNRGDYALEIDLNDLIRRRTGGAEDEALCEGEWSFSIPLAAESLSPTITIDRVQVLSNHMVWDQATGKDGGALEGTGGKSHPAVATLTNLQITATGASFYCDGLMDRLHATVILADGTEVENRGGGGSRMEDWPVPLDVTDIVAIRFGDAEIPLN